MKLSDVFTFFIRLCISNLDKWCVMTLCTLIRTPKGVGGAGEMLYLCTVERRQQHKQQLINKY